MYIRLSWRNVPPSPECGHFTSTIFTTCSGTLSSKRSPLVSSSTVYPEINRWSISGSTSRSCNMGSPPVISTSPPSGERRCTSCSISSSVIGRPPLKVYSLSHHVQRKLHPAVRTNTHGSPAYEDSPCSDL